MGKLIKKLEKSFLANTIDHYTVFKKEEYHFGYCSHTWLIFKEGDDLMESLFKVANRNLQVKFVENHTYFFIYANGKEVAFLENSEEDILELNALAKKVI